MAEAKVGALPALPTGLSVADPDVKEKYNESVQKVLSALENRSQIPWFKMAAAFADPGRTGTFGEAFGKAMGTIGQEQEQDRARALPIAQMRAQLAGQQYEMSKEEKALNAFAAALGTTPQNLQAGMAGAANNPAMMQRLNAAMPMFYGSPKIMEMAKTIFGQHKDIAQILLDERKAGMTEADLVAKYGKEILPMITGYSSVQGTGTTRPQAGAPQAGSPTTGGAQRDPNLVYNDKGEVVDVLAQPDANARTPTIQGQPITRPQAGETETTPVRSTSTVPTSPKIEADKVTFPDGQVIERGNSSLDAWNKIKQSAIESYNRRVEAEGESQRESRSKRGEPFQKKYDTLAAYDYNAVQTYDLMNRELMQLVKDHPKVVGQLVHQGPLYALLQAAESGISTPVGSLSAPVTEVLSKLKLTPEEQAVGRNVLQLISQLNQNVMRAGKDIYGPQISVFDAREMAKPGFATTDPASFIMYLASKNIVTNKYLGEMAEAQQRYFENNPTARTSSFFSSKNEEYTDIVKRLGATMRDLTQNSPFRK
jgi:hypothetical protein